MRTCSECGARPLPHAARDLPELRRLSPREIAKLMGVVPLSRDWGTLRGQRFVQSLRPIQGLDLTLLIEGEDHRPLGRMEIEAHDVPQLGDEGGILGELELLHSMGLEPVGSPNAGNRGVMTAATDHGRTRRMALVENHA